MENIYTFTPNEKAFIDELNAELQRRLKMIAEINKIQGAIAKAPDGTGFIRPVPATPAAAPQERELPSAENIPPETT